MRPRIFKESLVLLPKQRKPKSAKNKLRAPIDLDQLSEKYPVSDERVGLHVRVPKGLLEALDAKLEKEGLMKTKWLIAVIRLYLEDSK